jgi:hypothetical protein
MYLRLKSYNDLYAKDSKQWRYFTYCRESTDWTLAKENEDWKHENLPSIKHATLKWLVKTLVYVSEWDAKSYHFILMEVIKASQSNGEGYALALSDEGIEIGMEHEYFDSVQEILRYQRKLVERLFSNQQRLSMLKDNFAVALKARACSSEVIEMEQNYFEIFEPIKIARQKTGFASLTQINSLKEFCLKNENRIFLTIIGRKVFLCMNIPRLLLERKVPEALDCGIELMELFSQNRWLCSRFQIEFYRNSIDVSAIAVLENKIDVGTKCLSSLVEYFSEMDVPVRESAPYLILAKARLYELAGSKDDIEDALKLFRTNKDLVLQNSDYNVVMWSVYFCAKATMNLGYWKEANEFLNILNQRPYSDRAILSANARIMQLLCLLEIELDREYLIRFTETALMFVSRNAKDIPVLRAIAVGIRHALLSDDWSNEIQQLAIKVTEQTGENKSPFVLDFFDYPTFLLKYTTNPKNHQ